MRGCKQDAESHHEVCRQFVELAVLQKEEIIKLFQTPQRIDLKAQNPPSLARQHLRGIKCIRSIMLGEHRDEGVVHLLQRDSIEHYKISGTQMPPYQCLPSQKYADFKIQRYEC